MRGCLLTDVAHMIGRWINETYIYVYIDFSRFHDVSVIALFSLEQGSGLRNAVYSLDRFWAFIDSQYYIYGDRVTNAVWCGICQRNTALSDSAKGCRRFRMKPVFMILQSGYAEKLLMGIKFDRRSRCSSKVSFYLRPSVWHTTDVIVRRAAAEYK